MLLHCCAMVLAAITAPQGPDLTKPQWNAAQLASTDPAQVAWTAHHAAGSGDAALVPPLRKALRKWTGTRAAEELQTCVHLLDALIRLGAKVPAAELAPLLAEARTSAPAFILLALDPRLNERDLFELFRDSPPVPIDRFPGQEQLRMLAIGNLLAAQKTPGFAACAWQKLDLDLHIAVVSPAGPQNRPYEFRLAPFRRFKQLEGYPPDPCYCLTEDPLPANVLARGARTVGYRRDDASIPQSIRLDAEAPGGPGWLIGMAPAQLIAAECHLTCTWSTRQEYVEQVDAARQKLQRRKAEALFSLVIVRAITPTEAEALDTDVVVRIDDRRRDPNPPLPELPPAK